MEKPKTNKDAFDLIVKIVGSKTALAQGLGLAKQLISRWSEINPRHLEKTSELTKLPPDWVLPELDRGVSELLGRPAAMLLPGLIRLIYRDSKPPDRKRKKR